MSTDEIQTTLAEHWASLDDAAQRALERRLVALGGACLNSIKTVALDRSVEINTRKAAVCCIAAFGGDETASFLAGNFVIGKNPGALYDAFENGDLSGAYPLLMTAKCCLEKMGYEVRLTE